MKKTNYILLSAVAISLLATVANAALLVTTEGANTPLGDGSGITYTFTNGASGGIATETGDGAGFDLRTTTNTGGSFTLTFSSAVNLSIFNTEISQGNNFDPNSGDSAVLTANTGSSWAYAAGTYDLTDGNANDPTAGPNALSGLGTNVLTIAGTRTYFTGPGIAGSGAPSTETDWGTFSISGVTSITYEYTADTAFEGFRFDAVAVPEPSAFGLLGLGIAGLLMRRRRA